MNRSELRGRVVYATKLMRCPRGIGVVIKGDRGIVGESTQRLGDVLYFIQWEKNKDLGFYCRPDEITVSEN